MICPPQVCWVLGIFFITLLEIKFTRLLRLCLEWQSLSPEFTRGINLGRTSPVTLLSAGGLEWTYHYKNYLLFFYYFSPQRKELLKLQKAGTYLILLTHWFNSISSKGIHF